MAVGEVGDGFEGLCFGDILEVDIMLFGDLMIRMSMFG
jgi:hypothetical protein